MNRIIKLQVLIVICLIVAGMGMAGCGQTDKSASGGEGEYTSLEELDGKKVAVQMGSIFDKVLAENAKNVDVEYYNNFPDEITALDAKKVEGVPTTRMIFSQLQIEYESKYALIDEKIGSIPLAYLFPKNKEGKELTRI